MDFMNGYSGLRLLGFTDYLRKSFTRGHDFPIDNRYLFPSIFFNIDDWNGTCAIHEIIITLSSKK